jgi:hypothetical protein
MSEDLLTKKEQVLGLVASTLRDVVNARTGNVVLNLQPWLSIKRADLLESLISIDSSAKPLRRSITCTYDAAGPGGDHDGRAATDRELRVRCRRSPHWSDARQPGCRDDVRRRERAHEPTLPNGIVTESVCDAAGQLSNLTYRNGRRAASRWSLAGVAAIAHTHSRKDAVQKLSDRGGYKRTVDDYVVCAAGAFKRRAVAACPRR